MLTQEVTLRQRNPEYLLHRAERRACYPERGDVFGKRASGAHTAPTTDLMYLPSSHALEATLVVLRYALRGFPLFNFLVMDPFAACRRSFPQFNSSSEVRFNARCSQHRIRQHGRLGYIAKRLRSITMICGPASLPGVFCGAPVLAFAASLCILAHTSRSHVV